MRGRPVRTLVVVMKTLTGEAASRSKSMDSSKTARSGCKPPGFRS